MKDSQTKRSSFFASYALAIAQTPAWAPALIEGERFQAIYSDPLREFVNEVSGGRCVDSDMVLPACLAALSAAAGGKFTIRAAHYTNRCNLWTCVVAPSGSNKSQPAADAFAGLFKINRQLSEEYAGDLETAREAAPKADDATLMRKVKCRQVILNDTTSEALCRALADNPRGVLIYADELASFLGSIDRYNTGDGIAQLISLHDGKDLQINRKTDFTLTIKDPFLSVFGTIQPEVFASSLLNDRGLKSGFSQRFLVFYPKPKVHIDYYSLPEHDDGAVRRWEDLLLALYNNASHYELQFTPRAEYRYSNFYNAMYRVIDERQLDDDVISYVSKMLISVIKIAALMKIAHYRVGADFDPYIHEGDMCIAVRIALTSLDDFLTLYEAAPGGNPIMAKKEVARSLLHYCPDLTAVQLESVLGVSRATSYRWVSEYGKSPADIPASRNDSGEGDSPTPGF